MNDDADDTESVPSGVSAIAAEISDLKDSIRRTQEKRDPLPQPLFWSLFAHKVDAIRRKKALKTSLQEIFDP